MSQGASFNLAVSLAGTGFIGTTSVQIPAFQTITQVTTAVAGNVAISLPNIPQLGQVYEIINQSATGDFIMVYPSNYASGATRGTISAKGNSVACADAAAAGKPTCFALSSGCYAKFVASAQGANGTGATWTAVEWTVGTELLQDAAAAANNRTLNIFDAGKTFLVPALTVGAQTLITPTIAATVVGWNCKVVCANTLGQILNVGVAAQASIAGVTAQAASTNAPVATVITTNNQSTVNFTATAVAGDFMTYYIAAGAAAARAAIVYAQSCAAAGLTLTA